MLSLYIDGRRAVIKEGSTITLTLENPFYTDSGEYTYDVTLPLKGCVENQRIFGSLQHPAVSHKFLASRKYPFRLVTELLTLEGEAVVTSVTHEEVTVQLLAGNSALNFDMMGEDGELYIDEMDLGCAYDTLWQQRRPGEKQTLRGTLSWLLSNAFTAEERDKLLHGCQDDTECVCFPVYSTADEYWANEHIFTHWGNTEGGAWEEEAQAYIPLISTGNTQTIPNSSPEGNIELQEGLAFAAQPYLAVVLERILGVLGYEVVENVMRAKDVYGTRNWMYHIFVANARREFEYGKALPHWTVSEFFEELRNAYGLIVFVKNGKARILNRATYYSENHVELESVVDERTTEIGQESAQQDTTSGNVGYEFTESCDPWLNIGEDAYEQMEVRKVSSYTDIKVDELTQAEKDSGNLLFIDTYTDKRYAIFKKDGEYYRTEVDQMGPLFRDEDYSVDKQLRIIPCAMAANIPTYRVKWERQYVQGGISEYIDVEEYPEDPTNMDIEGAGDGGFFIPFLITADYVGPSTLELYNLQKALEEEDDTSEDKSEKQSVMEVALYSTIAYNSAYYPDNEDHSLSVNIKFPYPAGIPYYKNRKDGQVPTSVILNVGNNKFLLKYNYDAKKCLTDGALDIDTRVARNVSYLDRHADPNQVFLINGKKYVCQKIEITLDGNGVAPLKRGYFYEIH